MWTAIGAQQTSVSVIEALPRDCTVPDRILPVCIVCIGCYHLALRMEENKFDEDMIHVGGSEGQTPLSVQAKIHQRPGYSAIHA